MGFPGLETKTHMMLVAGPDTTVPVPVRLYYLTTDPYAVQFTFDVAPDEVVRWTFARELLDQGMVGPAGMGDVKITPIGDNHARTRIVLESPEGLACLEGATAPLKAWLDSTYKEVPAGHEPSAVDIDSLLDELLAH
ncbi:SsgA family sporulation/cell division regulator [Streptomyces sp. NPDC001787]|uniref:SsgA family sporulation/cell division regulator n=1 Tax=Streptomyces sp. NPDC001787 TaxID=3154523 RepID=UPI003325FD2C